MLTVPRPLLPPLLRTLLLPRLALLALCALLLAGTSGCEKARQERAHREAMAKIGTAIEKYSTASDQTNGAHRDVITAFAGANGSTNLPDYKAALRTKVVPAMDEFIAKLATMPTETPELKVIHGRLTEAYRRARDEIIDFEKGLQDPQGLRRFDEIRDGLQHAVAAYRDQLAAYYQRHERQLRRDSAKELAGDTTTTAAPPPDQTVTAAGPVTATVARLPSAASATDRIR